MMRAGIFLWIIFLPTVLYILLDSFYSHQSIDLTRNWLKLDSESNEMSHMASSLARYQRLIISSDFIQGVRIHDSSLRLVSYFGEIEREFTPSFPENNEIDSARMGFFSYRTVFVITTFDQKYLITFFFVSKVGRVTFLVVALSLIFLSLCFIFLNIRRSRREINKRIASVVRAIESYAHDIGNTLNWTKRLITTIEDGNTEKVQELSRYVEKTLRFSNGLRLEMLSLSKPKLNDVKAIDIKSLYFQCRDILVSDMSKIGILENFKHSILVNTDEIKISRVIINLLQNSYRHARSFISITTRDHKDGLILEITNDGDSVPKSIIKDAFKPFVSTSGSGLGLFICKTFVELHGGNIEMSSYDDVTKIRLWLPGCSRKVVSPQRRECESKFVIAIIDDELNHISEVTERFKDSHKFKLVVFTNVDDFFASLLDNVYFDMVVVDRFGPGFDSVEDGFPKIARNDFGFQGKIVLYSNSVMENEEVPDFDFCLSKEYTLDPEALGRVTGIAR